ncbi:hypothetical protein D047_3250A, partial [Vibrio parahaemolyticus VPTS-2010_2]
MACFVNISFTNNV